MVVSFSIKLAAGQVPGQDDDKCISGASAYAGVIHQQSILNQAVHSREF